jgi:peptide/nickel transport system ATP-binding protein
MTQNALVVQDLDIAYRVRGRDLGVLKGLCFHIAAGEAYGLVGDSGCGKSTLALGIVRYLPRNGRVSKGRILIGEHDLYALGDEEIRELRATTLSMVYQDAARALNPSIRVGEQIAEIFRLQGLPQPGRRKDHGRLDSIPGSHRHRATKFAAACSLRAAGWPRKNA